MSLPRALIITFLLGSLAACATRPGIPEPEQVKDLYLRGVFTWWEADENYKMQRLSDTQFKGEAELIADGQPYDFRIADANWSNGANCGYLTKTADELIVLDKPVQADCNSSNNNFKFTPKETAVYEFFIDFASPQPTVRIRKK
ncbi:hypothetical protein [Bowmanella denitrificans]|uniref:hypothetical protein n=1 Tax=Bowmanella denitrificans TaxID=366582 RepID=UPI000C9B1722|nr:hypothetical protein [Bowmanella denitrificans]